METPIYHNRDPPYVWLKAYEYPDRKKLAFRKRQVLEQVGQQNPFISPDCIKIVQVAILNMQSVFDIGIYINMSWNVFKGNVYSALKLHQDELDFNAEDIQDILFSNNPMDMSPAIDSTKHDIYTVFADNSIVFISQIKVDGMWIFFK